MYHSGCIKNMDFLKMTYKTIIIGLVFTTLLLSGCLNQNDKGELIKIGRVTNIRYDFMYNTNYVYFDDGTVVLTYNDDNLTSIRFNVTGRFVFQKIYYEHKDVLYLYHDFKHVEYINY